MRGILIAAVVVSTALSAATADAGAAPAGGGGRCFSKTETLKGKSVIVDCGPASASLRFKGKTYRFKPGTCLRTGSSVTLDLGISLVDGAAGNGGFAHMNITMLLKTLPAQVQADDGKLSIVGSAKFSGIAVKGTFSGTVGSFGGVSAGKRVPFSGSWNCGGPIQKF
jgi:hypothetical protein